MKGFNALVDGLVPKSAGLSSSSALVCCSALTMAYANGWSISKVRMLILFVTLHMMFLKLWINFNHYAPSNLYTGNINM